MGLNLLSLLPSTVLTVLLISVAFLRFYDQTDFELLGIIAQPRIWSNRLTMAAIVATLANLGVEWNRRNRETNRLAEEAQRRTEERERETRRTRIETRCRIAEIQFQLDPSEPNRRSLRDALAVLAEYGELL